MDHGQKLDLLDRSVRSPNLNPVKNFRGILVRRIYAEGKQYATVDELKSAITTEWNNIEISALQNLVSVVSCRIL